jgi:hypothetical protein
MPSAPKRFWRLGDEHVGSADVLHGDLNRQERLDAVRDRS